MLNRTIHPPFNAIKGINLIHPESFDFDNGLKCFVFKSVEQSLIKAEFVFENVFSKDENPLLNTALSSLVKEGTKTLTSAEIANQIDFYGAYLVPEYSYDYTSITVYTLQKYASYIFPIVHDILLHASIPKKELQTYIRNSKQSLQVSMEKNEFLARRIFYKTLFGDSRYGVSATLENLDAIGQEDLKQLYRQQFHPANCTLIVSGAVDVSIMNFISDLFGRDWLSTSTIEVTKPSFPNEVDDLIFEEKSDSIQSAIRLGRKTITRAHPDYVALQFVNTLFGGYFGSRLMRNIREEKGYTYSIGSGIISLKHAGFMTISSEVGAAVTKSTLQEIEKEMDILRHDKPSEEEVELVKNYMLGNLLGSLESVFSHADKFKAVYFNGLDLSYYEHYTHVIQAFDPDQVLTIAKEYFDYSKLTKIVVGNL